MKRPYPVFSRISPAGVAEAAPGIEALQGRLIIDVQPFDARPLGDLGGSLDQSPSDATPLMVGMHGGVQDEGVVASVPGELDEADQPPAVVGADGRQAAV